MSREIKFRGYDPDTGVMLPPQDLTQSGKHWTWLGELDIPLMQYTGLKDINGVEIYEGDIVDFWSRRDYDPEAPFYINRRKRRVVRWISNSHKNTINIRKPKDENLAYHEVIGNIYENHELLEAKQ